MARSQQLWNRLRTRTDADHSGRFDMNSVNDHFLVPPTRFARFDALEIGLLD